jgi:hypothetical protein
VTCLVPFIDVNSSFRAQASHNFNVPVPGCTIQSRATIIESCLVDVCAKLLEQDTHRLELPSVCGTVQGIGSPFVRLANVGAELRDQDAHQIDMAIVRRLAHGLPSDLQRSLQKPLPDQVAIPLSASLGDFIHGESFSHRHGVRYAWNT